MKKSILLSFLLLFLTITANAQLKVDATGKVGIQTTITNLQPIGAQLEVITSEINY